MRIVDYFGLDESERARVRRRLGESEWRAGAFLKRQLEAGTFHWRYGAGSRLLLGMEGESLAAFCTLAGKDDVENTPLTPWIGFVYTYPEYRGERRSGRLIERACALARADGFERVYLSSNEVGLYEKYGFTYLTRMKDAWGEDTGVYCRRLEA